MGGEQIRRAGRAFSLFAALVLAARAMLATAEASPWIRDKGRLFISTRTDYFIAEADEAAMAGAGPVRFERYDSDTYLEFGLTPSLMIGAKAVYGTSTYFDGTTLSQASGFSEIEGFVQRALWRNARQTLSVKLAGAAPASFVGGPRPDLQRDSADVELRALYGRNLSFSPFKLYATAEAGYRRRFGAGADELRADLLLGAEPARAALILCEVLVVKSLRNEDPGGADYDVVKIQPSLVWRAGRRWSLQAGLAHEPAGRNLLLGDAYFVALWTTF